MKQIITSLICLLSFVSVNATNCGDRYYIEEHIAVYVCHNYSRGADEAGIYYRGATKALNDYIQLKKDRGELKDKQFHIQMYSSILTQPQYHLSQSNEGYYIMIGRHLDLKELMKLINKFSDPNFNSLDVDISDIYTKTIEGESEEEKEIRYNKIHNNFETNEKKLFDEQISTEDLNYILNKEYITWQQKEMKFVYSKDVVKCFLKNKEIEHRPIGYPTVIQDRYILQECGLFKVYNEEAILLKRLPNRDDTTYCDYPFEAQVYSKWVDFEDPYQTKYSYSYDKNRFYLIENDESN